MLINSHAGAFRFRLESGSWTWSEALFALYGFDRGDVVPTTELVLTHQHPDDRDRVETSWAELVHTRASGVIWHRIVNARGDQLQVVTLVEPETDDAGRVVALIGRVVDLSEGIRRITSREVDAAIEQITRSRPLIDQAKGALMMTYAVDADEAFALLRAYSQAANVKIRDVARDFVDTIAAGGLAPDVRHDLDRLMTERRAARLAEKPGA